MENMSKFPLIILMGMSECFGTLFLSNLSMSFFISSILTSEKRNVSFSQLLCSAGMLGWVRSAMFSVTKLDSLYLEIFRFLTQGCRQSRGRENLKLKTWDFTLIIEQDISDKTQIAFSEFVVLAVNWATKVANEL